MDNILNSLNEMQREAVLDFEYPLLVLAGAGSGKTRVITSKIAYAIKNMHYNGWNILAVTFTNKAANEMRSRISTMIPNESINGLEMRTFHSFGAYVLRRFGSKIGLSNTFSIYDDEDSLNLLSRLYPGEKKSDLKEYVNAISRAKDKGLDPDSSLLSKVAYYLPDFRSYYKAYESALRKTGCVDFADLICKTTELLETNPDVKEYYASKFKLILVDEYQDTNAAQFRLLNALLGKETQLVVVGDDDQSIYKFRGAEIKNILNFNNEHPNTRIIKLEENYRSTKSILRIAAAVIKNNTERHDKTIFTNNSDGEKPKVLSCLDSSDEANKISFLIKSMKDRGSVAILYRNNAQSREFETTLSRLRIPYTVVGALRFYSREEIKDMISLMRFIVNPYDSMAFVRIINKPARALGPASQEKILSQGSHLLDALEISIKSNLLTGKAKNSAISFFKMCVKAIEMLNENCLVKDLVLFLMEESGLKEHYSNEPDAQIMQSKLDNLSALVNAVSSAGYGRDGLISFLESIVLDTGKGDEDEDEEAVKLMTMHNTKGLEFDTVFVTGLEEEVMPSLRDANEKSIEEERRLFYVAVTRARKNLYLSYVNKRMLWGHYEIKSVSRFLKEIPSSYYEGSIGKSVNASYTNHFAYTPRSNISNTSAWAKNIVTALPTRTQKSEVKVVKNVEYNIGDRVKSPDYGVGTIVDKEIRKEKVIIRVKFNDGKLCVYNSSYAQLEKIPY